MCEITFDHTKFIALTMADLSAPSGACKRPCNPGSWKQNKAKKARNSGLEYRSPFSGRMVAARHVGQPCGCTKNCFAAVGMDVIQAIHSDYWALNDHSLQTAFIQKYVKTVDIKKHYTSVVSSQRSCMREYFFKVADKEVTVCKKAFVSVLGVTLGRVDNAVKSQTASGVLKPDGRGKHSNHSRVQEERLQLVKDHINTFPTVSSHYTRYLLFSYSFIHFY